MAVTKTVAPNKAKPAPKDDAIALLVKHHVKEEQNEMFPKVKSSSLDMAALGARMAARKHELMAQAA